MYVYIYIHPKNIESSCKICILKKENSIEPSFMYMYIYIYTPTCTTFFTQASWDMHLESPYPAVASPPPAAASAPGRRWHRGRCRCRPAVHGAGAGKDRPPSCGGAWPSVS